MTRLAAAILLLAVRRAPATACRAPGTGGRKYRSRRLSVQLLLLPLTTA